jgi:MOSC domain-containing protein YiiM
MVTCGAAFIGIETGVAEDFRGKPGKRQVTILAEEAFMEACKVLQKNIPWTTRRANLLISGIQLENSSGKHLQIGDAIIEVTGETDPCYRMDEQVQGLKEALEPNWRGGVTGKVVVEGHVKIGDAVQWVEAINI